MILRIPDAYKLGFKYFFSLSEDEKNDLLDAIDKIEENIPIKTIPSYLAQFLAIDEVEIKEIISAFLSLFQAKEASNISTEEFIEELIDTFNKLPDEDIIVPSTLKDSLDKLFVSNVFYVKVKGSYLSSEREKLLVDSRIITDVRPIFSDDSKCTLDGMIIVHNLKMEYRHGIDIKEAFFALDIEDLEKLKIQIDRALNKERIMKGSLQDAKFKIIPLG